MCLKLRRTAKKKPLANLWPYDLSRLVRTGKKRSESHVRLSFVSTPGQYPLFISPLHTLITSIFHSREQSAWLERACDLKMQRTAATSHSSTNAPEGDSLDALAEKPAARWLSLDVIPAEWDILLASTCFKLLLFPA